MADDRQTPRRRRRPQAAPVSEEPVRIIVGTEEDTPDWMVSDTSGAASRRNKQKKAEPEAPRHTSRGAQETQAILQMKQTRNGRAADAAKKPAAPRKAPARKKKASARPMSKKARERRARKIRRLTIGALCGVIAVVLLIVGIRSGARLVDIKQTLDRGDGVFYPNIYVNDIPLQGKTLDEAAALVTQQVQSLISSFKITLRTQDGRSWDITGDSLNMQYNVADQLDQLWAIGHTGSSSVRYEQVKALEEEPAMRYTTLSYDMSQVNQILSQIKSEVDLPAVNATRVDDETKWPPFSYTDETAGQTLDITGLNERICTMVNMLESGVVDLTPVPVQPSVTRAQLEAQIVKLSSFETTVGKTGDYVESRTENIRVGTERFNRLTVAPGKSVSFNKVALKRTAANGYQAALEGGKLRFLTRDGQVSASVDYELKENDWKGLTNNAPMIYAEMNGKISVFTATRGELPTQYEEAARGQAGQELLAVKQDGLWGCIGMDGEVVVPFVMKYAPEISFDGRYVVGSTAEGYQLFTISYGE